MKNKKLKEIIVLVVKILLAIVFAVAFTTFVESKNQSIPIIAFNRNIENGVKITESDLVEVQSSAIAFQDNMIKKSEYADIIGKYTTTKVFKGNIAYKEQFGEMSLSDGLGSMDLSNSRVISLPYDMIEGFSGDIKAGDTVDLMYKGTGSVTDAFSDETSAFTYAKIFMQDIPVFQVNTGSGFKFEGRAHSFPYEKYSDDEEGGGGGEALASISLIVTPEQAEQIEARRMTGDLKFVKRFPESETHETLGYVIGSYGKIFNGHGNAETSNMQIIDNYEDEATIILDEESEDISVDNENEGE